MGPPCADQAPAANRSRDPCNTVTCVTFPLNELCFRSVNSRMSE